MDRARESRKECCHDIPSARHPEGFSRGTVTIEELGATTGAGSDKL
jgi:hypothetical protein